MRRVVLAAAMLLFAACVAQAQTPARGWRSAGDWSIRTAGDADNGCFAFTSDTSDASSFTLGYNRYANQFVLMAADDRWGIEAGKNYEIRLSFDKSPRAAFVMRGDADSGSVALLWEGEDIAALLEGLAANDTLHVEFSGKRAASFSLRGIASVLDSVLACRDAALARPGAKPAGTGSAREGETLRQWQKVGAWNIEFDPGMPGCLARLDSGAGELRFGTAGEKYYVAVRHSDWSWIEHLKDYDLSFVADGKRTTPLVLMGVNRQDLRRQSLLEEYGAEVFATLVSRFDGALVLSIRLDGRELARYPMGDFAAAIKQMHACNRANAAGQTAPDDETPKPWKIVGAWTIVSQLSICMATRAKPEADGTNVMAARDRADGSHMVAWINPAWSWVRNGSRYALILHFEPSGPSDVTAKGIFDNGNALGITGSAGLFDMLRTQRSVSLEYEGRRIGAVTLRDFELVARELCACIDAPYDTVAPTGRKR